MRRLRMLLLVLLVLPFALGAPADAAAAGDPSQDAALDAARARIDQIQRSLAQNLDDAALTHLRNKALSSQVEADAAAAVIEPQLDDVQVRLAQLGAPPAGSREAPDIAAQRSDLENRRRGLDAQLKLARLLSVEAAQTAQQIVSLRRSQFQARLGERTASILARPFWTELVDDLPNDLRRTEPIVAELRAAIASTAAPVWASVLLALAALVGLRLLLARGVLRLTSTRVPPGRLRRSVFAAALAALGAVIPGLMVWTVVLGLRWGGDLGEPAQALLGTLVGATWFTGYAVALGNALLSVRRPSWRLLPLLDPVAEHLRWFPLQLAIVIFFGWQAERLAALVNAGLSTAVAIDCIVALLLGTVIALALTGAWRVRAQALRAAQNTVLPAPLWVSVLAWLTWLLLAVSLVCLLIGFVAIGSFVVKQVAWTLVVVSSGYLLNVLIDDGCMAGFGSARWDDAADAGDRAPSTRGRDQVAVLVSGVARLSVLMLALVLLWAPFGEGPAELFRRAGQLQGGISIGEVQLRPAAVAQGLLVLGLAFLGVRLMQAWLARRLLPTTTLDPGMQLSATTLFGYAGAVVAVALGLSALGIGLERIAWVASALSVGIGFGLQAVVSNFVSGLILLAERPVKVGDWVSLAGVEGDIRRINVRATEIQMGDRSTVIVPNSEFITKIVRNVTLANPLGLVQIKLPMPLDSDAERVRSLMLGVFDGHDDVLETPAPSVSLDGIDGANLVFNATGYVSSPRLAYGVRSALLFELLTTLRDAGIRMAKPSTVWLAGPAAENVGAAVEAPAPAGVAGPPPLQAR